MKDGTYSHCTECKLKHNCCNDFDSSIDNIMVTKNEKDIILDRKGDDYAKYFKSISENAYHLINVEGSCPFYSEEGCSIYDIRPSDCRLFPYDIKNIDNNYYLIKYDLPCGSANVKELPEKCIETLFEIIDIYTSKDNEKLVNNLPYKIIKKI